MKQASATAVILLLLPLVPLRTSSAQQGTFTFQHVLELGLANNPQLKAHAMEVEALRSAYRTARLLFNPTLDMHTGTAESWDLTERRHIEGITLTQPLENPLTRGYRIGMAENEWRAAEYSMKVFELDIAYRIKEQFFRILLFKSREELAGKNLESLLEAYSLVERKVELGETRELEAIKLNVEVMRARNEFNRLVSEERLSKQQLNALLGNTLPDQFELSGELEFNPIVTDEAVLLESALSAHPMIGRSERVLEYARDRLRFTRSGRIPDPELSGFVENGLDGEGRGIGISLAIPLWNMSGRQIAGARSMVDSREYELEGLKLELRAEISIRYSWLQLSAERIEIFRSGLLMQAEESLAISEASYLSGELSLLEYLDSQRTYYSILNDYQDSLFEWNLNRAALERAVGEEIR